MIRIKPSTEAVMAENTGPTVSVVVPVFNQGQYLPETISSVQSQSLDAWECIVVNDGSTDDSRAVAEAAARKDARFRVVSQENHGLAAARNAGLSLARGRYVQFLDSDDLIAPDKLAVQARILDESPEVDVPYSNYRPFDSGSGRLLDRFWPDMLGEDPLADFLFRWERGLCIPIHAALFRRSLFREGRAFDEEIRAKEDWLLWIELAARGCRFRFLDSDMALYRMHGGNMFRRHGEMSLAFLQAALKAAPLVPESYRDRFARETAKHVGRGLNILPGLAGKENGESASPASPEDPSLCDGTREEGTKGQGDAVAGCTIVARNFMARARVLAESFLKNEPGGRFYILVVDAKPGEIWDSGGANLLFPRDLPTADFRERAFKYDVTELCTSLKPAMLAHLLEERGEREVFYLDPDVWIARPLVEAKEALRTADLVLTPHFLEPTPADGKSPSDWDTLATGVFNLGFLGVRQAADARRFLVWWDEKLRDACLFDPATGLFVDQKWVDLAPIFVPSSRILRDETYNVAYWNLHSRVVEHRGADFFVNGQPLAFFHFSGVDPETAAFRPKNQDRITVTPESGLGALIAEYVGRIKAAGEEKASTQTYGFSRYDDGRIITPMDRARYRALSPSVRSSLGDPFSTADGPANVERLLDEVSG